MRQFAKIEPGMWQNRKMRKLTRTEKLLFAYLLSGPHMTFYGAAFIPSGYAAVDISTSFDEVESGLGALADAGLIEWDAEAEIVAIVGWWENGINRLDNPAMAKGAAKGLREMLPSPVAISAARRTLEQGGDNAAKAADELRAIIRFGDGSLDGSGDMSRGVSEDGSLDGFRDGSGDGSRDGSRDGSGDGSRDWSGDGSGDGSRDGSGDGSRGDWRLETRDTKGGEKVDRQGDLSDDGASDALARSEASSDGAQVRKAVDVWNEVAGPVLGRIVKMTPQRKTKLKARLRGDFNNSTEQWRMYVESIVQADFLTGKNDRGWKANFDWVLEPNNAVKIMEGKYQNTKSAQPSAII